jgi:hypothetical protein
MNRITNTFNRHGPITLIFLGLTSIAVGILASSIWGSQNQHVDSQSYFKMIGIIVGISILIAIGFFIVGNTLHYAK